MATVTFYSGFSKRSNSTKQPTSGTDKTVVLKESTSIENPTFILNETLSSVAGVSAAKWDSRYYFVTDITSVHNGITEITCALDRGATYKSAIGATNAFIERCSNGYNYMLRDNLVLTTCENFFEYKAGGQFLPSPLRKGVIAVTVANDHPSQVTGGTSEVYYFDSEPSGTPPSYDIKNLMDALYDSTVSGAITTIMNKPYDAILSVRYIPGFTCADLLNITAYTSTPLMYFGQGGSYSLSCVTPRNGFTVYTYTKSWEFDLGTVKHFSIYEWRNLAPYSKWDMFLPFYGTISIPAEEYLMATGSGLVNLLIKATIDLTTGELVYTRYRRKYVGGVATDYVAQEYRTSIGVDILIQGSQRNMLSFASDLVSGAGSVALLLASGGSTAGAIAAGAGSLASATMDITQQNIMTAGTFNAQGTQIATAEPNDVYLMQTGFETQTTPTSYGNVIGGPLMQADTISNRPGYIKCNNASVSMTGTQADKDAVNAMLNSGFFYE